MAMAYQQQQPAYYSVNCRYPPPRVQIGCNTNSPSSSSSSTRIAAYKDNINISASTSAYSSTTNQTRSTPDLTASSRLSSSSSSSDTSFTDSDEDFDESDTDVDDLDDIEDAYHNDTKSHNGVYSYCLMPALAMASFTPGPSSLDAPWPYTFQKGDTAFAKAGANGTWRRVTLLDNGFISYFPLANDDGETRALVYTAQWVDASGRTVRGRFCPTRGDIKPVHDPHVRRLLVRHA